MHEIPRQVPHRGGARYCGVADRTRDQGWRGYRANFVGRIADYCLSFETFPERGTRHDDVAHGLRTVGWRRRATIAFEVVGNTVVILRVLYAGRTLELPDED